MCGQKEKKNIGNLEHSVRRIIIFLRRTFTFTVSKIIVILYLEETGGDVRWHEGADAGYYYMDKKQ